MDHPLEREADAMADRVLRMPTPKGDARNGTSASESDADAESDADSDSDSVDEELSETPTTAAFAGAAVPPSEFGVVVQRDCASCSSETNEVRRSSVAEVVMRECSSCEDDDPLRRSFAGEQHREAAAGTRGGPATSMFSSDLRERQRLGGQRLSASLRGFFEPRFAAGLGQVRLHTDAPAGALAQRINARAFTVGQHIFFAPGEYRPRTEAGLRLMAHELAHTLQNVGQRLNEGEMRRVSADGLADRLTTPVRPAHDPDECAADAFAHGTVDFSVDFSLNSGNQSSAWTGHQPCTRHSPAALATRNSPT
ncbi:MAG: DUF4157 domain-containing protein [Enhygromyxa sp.]